MNGAGTLKGNTVYTYHRTQSLRRMKKKQLCLVITCRGQQATVPEVSCPCNNSKVPIFLVLPGLALSLQAGHLTPWVATRRGGGEGGRNGIVKPKMEKTASFSRLKRIAIAGISKAERACTGKAQMKNGAPYAAIAEKRRLAGLQPTVQVFVAAGHTVAPPCPDQRAVLKMFQVAPNSFLT